MSIRDLSVPFTIEVTGEDVEVFLKKEEITSKYFEVISMPEVEEKMEETVISLSRFAKILNVHAEINLDSISDMVLFNVVAQALSFSVKDIIINGKKAEEVIPSQITAKLVIEIINEIKYAMITELSRAVPTRTRVIVDETGGMYS